MNILVVKLSSLGDVVHAMPAVQDLRAAFPQARIDWVVERAFVPLVARCEGVQRVVPCELRRWRRAPLARETREAWRAFRGELRGVAYDAVLDLQGLTKSGLVARLARRAPGGRHYAMANRTHGSSYEPPTRWLADVAVPVEPDAPAVQRGRAFCAAALHYPLAGSPRFGLAGRDVLRQPAVALVHGSSREDKCWPEPHWVALGRRLVEAGYAIALPHGSDAEQARSERLAAQIGSQAEVWPRLALDAVVDRMAGLAGVVGVDTGLSHVAVALDLPHVQVYNFPTAWRTGPQGSARQRSVEAEPTPSLEAVWQAWLAVRAA